MPRASYPFAEIEPKWQAHWQETELFECDVDDASRPPYYCLTMYPYPSGALHMGHVINYSIGDALVRYHLMQGENVLSPMGWDSFGLPAENAAIKAGVPPAVSTRANIDKMREQMTRAGWGYDWRREIATSHPGYYRWTQWLFLQFYKAGLASRRMAPVNWCPSCQTVLANEQVHDGGCERCGSRVEPRDLEQWFLAMSRYAQRLLDGHQALRGKWPDRVLKMQQQWIGRSEGARIDFRIEAPGTGVDGQTLPVFTTRPDTTYGVTFMALAPEHPHVEKLLANHPRRQEMMEAVRRMRAQSVVERTSEESEKEGIPTGHRVVNPFDGSKAPIWVTNYALMEYGTGAVMAVPAHDERDLRFARGYGIPVKVVIQPEGESLDPDTMEHAYVEDGVQVNSGPFDGMGNRQAIRAMTQHAKDHGFGDFTVHYRLRDWLVSRQRYWGAPIPIVYCPTCGEVAVPEADLPVLLPDEVEFSRSGQSPLETCEEWVHTTCPTCSGPARRETDTMDTFVDSSWYFLRYLTPRDEERAFDRERCRRWLPVHQYVGGIEHATMHLIYARFFTMVLHDLGLLDFEEPFERLFCQGMVCNEAYRADYYFLAGSREPVPEDDVARRADGTAVRASDGKPVVLERVWLPAEEVDAEKLVRTTDGHPVHVEMAKMSKSKYNGVAPDELFGQYGADTVHTYILFVGPADQDIEYSDQGVIGVHRFLNRFWNLVGHWAPRLADVDGAVAEEELDGASKALRRKAHQSLRRVTESFDPPFRFNTAIAAIMELANEIRDRAEEARSPAAVREAVAIAVQCLSPFAPHLCEELWHRLGHEQSVFRASWPRYDAEAAKAEEIEIPIQVNGKVRSRVTVDAEIDEEGLREAALADAKVRARLADKQVERVVVVPRRLVNIVAR
ncbi:MAG: leucine--tRNA ligase [bacterium]